MTRENFIKEIKASLERYKINSIRSENKDLKNACRLGQLNIPTLTLQGGKTTRSLIEYPGYVTKLNLMVELKKKKEQTGKDIKLNVKKDLFRISVLKI